MRTRRTATPLRSVLLWGPVAAFMAALFLVSSSSNPPAPAAVSDKVLHLSAYAVLGVLVFRALAGGLPAALTRRTVLLTLVIAIGYGATDEVHQMFVPMRSPELLDLAADAAGVVTGLIACWAWSIIEVPKPRPQNRDPKEERRPF